MKARLALALLACIIMGACAGPSLRYKKEVTALFEKGAFENAAAKIETNRSKMYGERDAALFYLDFGTALNAAQMNLESSRAFGAAQDEIDALFTRSIAAGLGTLIINDYTQPYRPRLFEQALTYFLRGLDFLALGEQNSAVVEARRAVFFLDNARNNQSGLNDDAFVQYFASMLFEDRGQLSSARIARTNARNAYERNRGRGAANEPDFPLPPNHRDMGEVIIFHMNGKVPFKISKSIMFAWNDVWFTVQGNSDLAGVDRDIMNGVLAGAFGRSISISFPSLEQSPFIITSSAVMTGGQEVRTQLVSDIAAAARQTLDEELLVDSARMITRAVTKYILSVQARHAAKKISGDDAVGQLVGALFSVASAVTERADTRSWFTLPAEIRMASVFLEPGRHDIKLVFYDNAGRAVDEKAFNNVQINRGARTYLYHRTAR